MNCPKCGSDVIVKAGTRLKSSGEITQRFECKNCGRRFVDESIPTKDVQPKEFTKFEQEDDYINIVCSSRRIKTKEDVIDEFEIDTEKWKLEKYIVRTDEAWRKDRKVDWHVTNGIVSSGDVEDSGKILVVPITRIECRFVRREIVSIDAKDILEYYKTHKFETSTLPIKKYSKIKVNKVLEICLADWHIGARWYDRNWSDLEKLFPYMFADIINQASGVDFSEIWIVPLGDIFHYENRQQETERHQQRVNGNGMNPLEMYDYARKLFVPAINTALEIAPVKTWYIPGNHDGIGLYHLLCDMESRFINNKHYVTDLRHTSRKWNLFGKNLIAWEHGEMPKKNQLHWLMTDAAEDWGKSKYREIHWGHLHSEEVIEFGGLKRRRLPAIAPTDYWHHRNGYIGATRATMAFVWEENRIGFKQMWQSTGI